MIWPRLELPLNFPRGYDLAMQFARADIMNEATMVALRLGQIFQMWRRWRVASCALTLFIFLGTSQAQESGRVHRVGFVLTTSPIFEMLGTKPKHGGVDAFLREMEANGFVEGKNLIVERRSAEGKFERFGDIISELLDLKVEAIVTVSNAMALRAKELTKTVPIVMALSNDPVGNGIVQSLARPGGNVTGFSLEAGPEQEVKRLSLLREMVPSATNFAFLGSKDDWTNGEGRSVRAAAERLHIRLFLAESRPNDLTGAFATIQRERSDAIFVAPSPQHWANRLQIVDFALKNRLPMSHISTNAVEAGGLMSYGLVTGELFRSAGRYVAKILRGAKPADLPIEQPAKFELAINRKTAKALGLTIPQSVQIQTTLFVE